MKRVVLKYSKPGCPSIISTSLMSFNNASWFKISQYFFHLMCPILLEVLLLIWSVSDYPHNPFYYIFCRSTENFTHVCLPSSDLFCINNFDSWRPLHTWKYSHMDIMACYNQRRWSQKMAFSKENMRFYFDNFL